MTTTPQSTSTHRDHLVKALGPDTTNAIVGLVGEELAALIAASNDVVAQQRVVVKEAKASGDRDAIKAANQATPPVKAAAKAVEEAQATGDPDKIADAKDKVEEAKDKVTAAQAAINDAVMRHEAILAEKHEGPRPPSRIDRIETDITTLRAATDQSVSASANALAIARASGGAPIWAYAVGMFITVLVAGGVLDVFIDIKYFWYVPLAALAAAGGTALSIVIGEELAAGMDKARGERAEARSDADAHDDELDVTQYDPERLHANAQASANVRQSA